MQNVAMILGLLWGCFWLLRFAGVSRATRGRAGLAAVLAFTGTGHFVRTAEMAEMLPPWVPEREWVILATGGLEWIAAGGLFVPPIRRWTGILLCLFLVAAFPANIYAALHRVDFGGHDAGPIYLAIRFPLQLLLIAWVYRFAVRPEAGVRSLQSSRRSPGRALAGRFFELGIEAQERALGVSLDYMRAVAAHAPALAAKLALLAPLGGHRRALPKEVFHLARIQATLAEDCGACVQMAVNVARKEGVAPELVRAVIRGDLYQIPPLLAEVCHYVDATLMDMPSQNDLRELIRDRYGEEGLIELSAAVALAGFFPRFKRGLGVSQSCLAHPAEV